MTDTHYRETQYGFEYGWISVERCWSHKGAVCVRMRNRRTGEFIEMQTTPAGMKSYFGDGTMLPDRENEREN